MITVQKVSGAMRRARIEASTSSRTMVRGWRSYTTGVRVHLCGDDSIGVYWLWGSRTYKPTPEIEEAKLKLITDALDAAGIKYTRGQHYRLTIEANQ